MNADRTRALILALALAVIPGAAQVKPRQPGAKLPSLIRKEWLRTDVPPPSPPRRDIFSTRTVSAANPARAAEILSPAGRMAAEKADEIAPEAAPAFDLRYFGYSFNSSRKKIVGLVLLNGQAVAVEEGDTPVSGFKITAITRKAVEIVGPDGKILTFALQGGER